MIHPYLDNFDISQHAITCFKRSISYNKTSNGQTKVSFRFENSNKTSFISEIDFAGTFKFKGINHDAILYIPSENKTTQVHFYLDPISALVGKTILDKYNKNEAAILILPFHFNENHIKYYRELVPKSLKEYEHFVAHNKQFKKGLYQTQKALELEALLRSCRNRFNITAQNSLTLKIEDSKKDKIIIYNINEKKNASLARFFFNNNYRNSPKQLPKALQCKSHGVYHKQIETVKYYS